MSSLDCRDLDCAAAVRIEFSAKEVAEREAVYEWQSRLIDRVFRTESARASVRYSEVETVRLLLISSLREE